jgi:hypothetical protein
MQAPSIEVREGDPALRDEEPRWVFTYRIRNIGGSIAHNVVLHTDPGEAAGDELIEPGGALEEDCLPNSGCGTGSGVA